jgi:hypothetical protein
MKHEGEVTVVALMEGRESEKVLRPGAVVGDGAAAVQRNGGNIVAHGVCSGFTAVGIGGDDIMMQDSTCLFKVALGYRAMMVRVGDELGLDRGGPSGAPKDRR